MEQEEEEEVFALVVVVVEDFVNNMFIQNRVLRLRFWFESFFQKPEPTAMKNTTQQLQQKI